MKPTPESLQAHYAELNDAALLRAAAQHDDLTLDAQHALTQELESRSLQVVPQAAVAEPEQDLPSWVTVDRFRDLSSAIVARGALQAAGVRCFLRDENTVRLDWQISNMIGGMRLQVQEPDREASLEILSLLGDAEDEVNALEPEEHCPFCGSSDVHRTEPGIGIRAAALLLFAFPVPRRSQIWQCHACGRQCTENDLALTPQS